MEIIFTDQTDTGFFDTWQNDMQAVADKAKEMLAPESNWQLSVVAMTPGQIHEINRDYRHIDRATDVISFAAHDGVEEFLIPEEEDELGDIFINIEAVKDQARAYGHSEKREACFLFCHGLLHLLGYDHMEPEDEKEMSALQEKILNGLAERQI